MDGPEDYDAKWSKPEEEQTPCYRLCVEIRIWHNGFIFKNKNRLTDTYRKQVIYQRKRAAGVGGRLQTQDVM